MSSGRNKQQQRSDGAFYTVETVARHLARITIAKVNIDWTNPKEITNYRICDPACGEGVLLKCIEREFIAKQKKHGVMNLVFPCLIGLDVYKPALEIAAESLNPYAQLWLMPFGPQADGTVRAGSLELLIEPDPAKCGGIRIHGKKNDR